MKSSIGCLIVCLFLMGCSSGGSSGSSDDSSFVDDSLLLSWDHPVMNDDGSDLDFNTVSGYKIYWSPVPGPCEYHDEIFFVTSDHESLRIIDLLPGIHYFQVTTVLHDGTESECSAEVFRFIGEG